MMTIHPIIIIGAGGHARVLLDALTRLDMPVLGVVDNDPEKQAEGEFHGVPILGGDDFILKQDPAKVRLVNGVGSVRRVVVRKQIFERFKAKGFTFEVIVDPYAFVAPGVTLGEGTQVLAGAVLQTGSVFGLNSIINTGAIVDHECEIGAHCHIAPGTVLSGQVRVKDESHIGTGARVIQGIEIGRGCTIGAGAAVIEAVPDHSVAVGVPAKVIRTES